MAVIQPWYDPSFDVGAPVLETFWTNFTGTRSKINEQIMRQRLQSADPTERMRTLRTLIQSKTDLAERKIWLAGQLESSSRLRARDQIRLQSELIKALTSMATTNVKEAGALQRSRLDNSVAMRQSLMERGAELRAKRDDGVAQASQSIDFLGTNPSRSEYDRELAKAEGMGAYERAGYIGTLYEHAKRNNPDVANAIAREMMPGFNPSTQDVRQYFKDTTGLFDAGEEDDLVAEIESFGGVGADPAKVLMKLGAIYADENATPEEIRRAAREAAGGISGVTTELSPATQTSPESMAEIKAALEFADSQIQEYQDAIDKLGFGGADITGGGDPYQGLTGNPMLHTMLRASTPGQLQMRDVLSTLSEDQAALMAESLDEANGDYELAIEILKEKKRAGRRAAGQADEVPDTDGLEAQPWPEPEPEPPAEKTMMETIDEGAERVVEAAKSEEPKPKPEAKPAQQPKPQPATAQEPVEPVEPRITPKVSPQATPAPTAQAPVPAPVAKAPVAPAPEPALAAKAPAAPTPSISPELAQQMGTVISQYAMGQNKLREYIHELEGYKTAYAQNQNVAIIPMIEEAGQRIQRTEAVLERLRPKYEAAKQVLETANQAAQ